jgi:hypothetical protein
VRLYLLLLVGCGRIAFDPIDDASAPPDEDGTHSGTRLKIEWHEYEGGLRQPKAVWDSQLSTYCLAFGSACVPVTVPSSSFSDPACSTRVARVSPCSLVGFISTSSQIYRKGARLATTTVYETDGTNCSPVSITDDVFELGAELLPDEMAPLSIETVPGTRLDLTFLTSPDGFRMQHSVYDHVLGEDCGPVRGVQHACIPSTQADATFASDSGCTQLLAGFSPMPPEAPTYAFAPDFAGCPTNHVYYPIANEVVAPTAVYKNFGASGCQPVPIVSERFFTVGAPVALQDMAEQFGTTPARRIQPGYMLGGGITYREPAQLDTELGATCTPVLLSDGSRRCVPGGPNNPLTRYADASCTMPVDVVETYVFDGCAPAAVPRYTWISMTNGCDYSYELHDVGAELTGAYYQGAPGTCQPISTLGITLRRFAVGGVADLSALSTVSIVRDP